MTIIPENLKAEAQALYDEVRTHLLSQGRVSKADYGMLGKSSCAYRGADGLKCAIGCRIADSDYFLSMEGSVISDVVVAQAAKIPFSTKTTYSMSPKEEFRVEGGLIGLATELQQIHDCRAPQKWWDYLDALADNFGLKITYTKQEIFTQVRRSLLIQMKKSLKDVAPNVVPMCVYLSNSGLKCAIGHLIPKAKYQSSFELISLDEVVKTIGLKDAFDGSMYFLRTLQRIHDSDPAVLWSHRLDTFARQHDLKLEPLWLVEE